MALVRFARIASVDVGTAPGRCGLGVIPGGRWTADPPDEEDDELTGGVRLGGGGSGEGERPSGRAN